MINFNPKKPGEILAYLLHLKKIPGTVHYDRKRHSWMYVQQPGALDKLGSFAQAIVMITGGTMDYLGSKS